MEVVDVAGNVPLSISAQENIFFMQVLVIVHAFAHASLIDVPSEIMIINSSYLRYGRF